MSLPSKISVWDLWSESAKQSETLGDPLFLECLEAASNSRIFDDLTDDKLKISLSIINSFLNDPKTKPKGLTLFCDLATQVNSSRLIGFQDAVISILHLIVKSLESPLASTALANFLPKCHCMSEVNQVVTTSIIPKLLGYFVEENKASQRTFEEFSLLKVCLMEYHGPCGHFRDKLEKLLIPLIDSENTELIQVVSDVMPLISYAGGGGDGGEKHVKDWNAMLTKCLKTAYSTMIQMYGDSCTVLEPDNPFDGEQLTGLKRIAESQVLLRLSLLKRRLQNLLSIISGYLRFPFPAVKLVPQKGILRLIACLTSGIPFNTRNTGEKTLRKEEIFLVAITPGVHMMALNLMRCLFDCVGSNIFTDGSRVEEIICSEFKSLQEKPRAFEKLRLELYDTLGAWLALTRGNVTNLKTLALWVDAIGVDTRVEKDIVELKILSKPKPGKSVQLMNTSSMTLSSSSATQVFVLKSSEVCQMALNTLARLIPALDKDSHKKIYEHLLKTSSIICQFQNPPSPYDSPDCRKLIYENLIGISHNPNPQSPISIPLIATLLRRGMLDSTKLVSAHCAIKVSQLERLLHPAASPLILAGLAPSPVIMNNYSSVVDLISHNYERDDESSVSDDALPQSQSSELNQTARSNSNTEVTASVNSLDQETLLASLMEKMVQNIKDVLSSYPLFDNENEGKGSSSGTSVGIFRKESVDKQRNSEQSVQLASSSVMSSELPCFNESITETLDTEDEADSESALLVNGNGYYIEENLEPDAAAPVVNISEDDTKRKADSLDDVEYQVAKKSKTTSPKKQDPTQPGDLVDEPSLDDMLSTFVNVEPVA